MAVCWSWPTCQASCRQCWMGYGGVAWTAYDPTRCGWGSVDSGTVRGGLTTRPPALASAVLARPDSLTSARLVVGRPRLWPIGPSPGDWVEVWLVPRHLAGVRWGGRWMCETGLGPEVLGAGLCCDAGAKQASKGGSPPGLHLLASEGADCRSSQPHALCAGSADGASIHPAQERGAAPRGSALVDASGTNPSALRLQGPMPGFRLAGSVPSRKGEPRFARPVSAL